MLTKSDLAAIQKMFDGVDKRFNTLDKRIDSLSNSQQQNSEDLIELITSGFDRTEKAIRMINDHDERIENHEHRLDKIEDKIFA